MTDNDAIFQFLNFQKEAHGDKTFTVNMAVRPLFIPKKHLTLKPGNRIGDFVYSIDKWWDFRSEQIADESFAEVQQIILDHILHWFDKVRNTNGLIELFVDPNNKHLLHDSECWRYFDLGHLYAKNQQYDQAMKTIELALHSFNLIPYDWSKEAGLQCQSFLNILEAGQAQVEEYLKQCETISKTNLGLLDSLTK